MAKKTGGRVYVGNDRGRLRSLSRVLAMVENMDLKNKAKNDSDKFRKIPLLASGPGVQGAITTLKNRISDLWNLVYD